MKTLAYFASGKYHDKFQDLPYDRVFLIDRRILSNQNNRSNLQAIQQKLQARRQNFNPISSRPVKDTPLIAAVKRNDVNAVEKEINLLMSKKDFDYTINTINQKDSKGRTALDYAQSMHLEGKEDDDNADIIYMLSQFDKKRSVSVNTMMNAIFGRKQTPQNEEFEPDFNNVYNARQEQQEKFEYKNPMQSSLQYQTLQQENLKPEDKEDMPRIPEDKAMPRILELYKTNPQIKNQPMSNTQSTMEEFD